MVKYCTKSSSASYHGQWQRYPRGRICPRQTSSGSTNAVVELKVRLPGLSHLLLEPLPFLLFFFVLSLSLSPFSFPPPPFLDACVVAGGIFVSSFFLFLAFLLSLPLLLLCFIWFPLRWPPHTLFPSFLSCPFCVHVLLSSPFSSLARTSARTLACAHTRVLFHQTRFRCPRFVII